MWKNNRMEAGERTGRKLLGEKWDHLIEALSGQNQDITKYIVEWGYGEVYNRPHLSYQQREIIALTSLAIQGLKPQLKTHVIAALNSGLKQDEIMEAFIHLALFSGFPVALFGIQTAREVFDEGQARKPPEKESSEDSGV
jgi:4-carboxymuconolactone decarboxylase